MSSEDFKSFIVTNPDLVDEGIDISGLRTNTDASILGNIPDYGGIQYEAYNPNRLSDLMRLYSGGLPMLDTPQAVAPVVDTTPVVDTIGGGGMDQATGGLDTTQPFQDLVNPNVNIDEFANENTTMPSNLTSDMVGNIGTTPVDTYTSPTGNVAPDGTTMAGVGGYLDGIDLDNTFAGTPVNTPSGNNPFGYEDLNPSALAGPGINETSGLDDIGQAVGEEFADTPVNTPSGNNPFGYEDLNPSALAGPDINNPGAFDDFADVGVDNTVDYGMPQGSPGQLNPAAPSIEDITAGVTTPSSFDYETEAYGTVNEVTEDPTMQETISNAFTSAKQGIGDLATASVDKIQEVGQSIANTIGGIYNDVDQTINVFGREINVPATLAGIALSQAVGAPINIAFGVARAIGGTLPQDSLENSITRSIAAELTAEKDYGYNMQSGNIGQDPFGRNPVSAFGNYEQTLMDDINNPSNTNLGQKKTEYANDYFDKKAEKAGGVVSEPGTVVGPGEMPVTQKEMDAFNETPTEKADKEAGVTTGDASVAEAEAEKDREEAAAAAADQASIDRGQSLHGGPEGTTGGTTGAVGGTTSGTTGATQDNSSGVGGSCFIAGTKVTMSDDTLKNIENIVVGDKVKGHKNDNEVIKLDPTLLANRKLYSFNDNNHYFFTSEHPFMTEEGWKSIKPEKTKERDGVELYNQLEGELKIGDKLVTDKGLVKITDIKSKEINKLDMPLYNFNVSNDNSYIADGYVVHNKGGGGTHICTASYANNLITILDFKSLKKYGIKLRRNDKYLMKAYDWFGPKLAAAVKKGKLVNFAKHSTSMWKYEQTKEDVSFKIKFMSRLHKIITRPILRALGVLLTIKEKLTK